MSVSQSAEEIWENPFGRLLTLLIGVSLVFGTLTLYPQTFPIINWAIPVVFVLWGVSRFYLYGVDDKLTTVAGCLLLIGGLTLAAYRLVPVGDLTDALAHLIPTLGIFIELFANHYRNHD